MLRFVFQGARTEPLAVATWAPPCEYLRLAITGRPSVPLMTTSPATPIGAQFYPLVEGLFPPQRVSRVESTVHSSATCASVQSGPSTLANPQSAPGAAAGSCISASRLTTSA